MIDRDALYDLRIRQFASNGIEPYCDWFTKEELDKWFSDPKNRERIYIKEEVFK